MERRSHKRRKKIAILCPLLFVTTQLDTYFIDILSSYFIGGCQRNNEIYIFFLQYNSA